MIFAIIIFCNQITVFNLSEYDTFFNNFVKYAVFRFWEELIFFFIISS